MKKAAVSTYCELNGNRSLHSQMTVNPLASKSRQTIRCPCGCNPKMTMTYDYLQASAQNYKSLLQCLRIGDTGITK
jgi:hypothetical protein